MATNNRLVFCKSSLGGDSMNKSRFMVGIILIALSIFLLVFMSGSYSTAGAVALAVLGLISIAISRRR